MFFKPPSRRLAPTECGQEDTATSEAEPRVMLTGLRLSLASDSSVKKLVAGLGTDRVPRSDWCWCACGRLTERHHLVARHVCRTPNGLSQPDEVLLLIVGAHYANDAGTHARQACFERIAPRNEDDAGK